MPIPTRRNARILAFQITYHRTKIGIQREGEELLFANTSLTSKHREFCRKLIDTTWKEQDKIDLVIQRYLKNWKQTRITDTLNALLRVGTCELLFFPETDGKIVFNETIEICRHYVDERATKLCNGVLHTIWQNEIPKPE